jgi:hypothetical protein
MLIYENARFTNEAIRELRTGGGPGRRLTEEDELAKNPSERHFRHSCFERHRGVKTQPTSGKMEAAVKILGSNLTGATRVTFNGYRDS